MSNSKIESAKPVATPVGHMAACGREGERDAVLHIERQVDVLIGITAEPRAAALRAEARRCRRLADSLTDQRVVDTLLVMAREYDAKAQSLQASP